MKPLLGAVVAVCLLSLSRALPENIEDVKSLPQDKEPILEAEDSEPQARAERCTTCGSGGLKLGFKSPNEVLAAIQAIPGAEVHTQSTFEGCSSEKGCAGIKVKDGRVIERFGNVDSFNAAAAADSGNEFSFHAAGSNWNNVFEGGIPKDGPFWWMNENSPFKAGANGGSYEKFSKSSSSSFTSGGGSTTGVGNGGGAFSGSLDLTGNPFLNGEFSKTGFAGGASQGAAASFSGSESAGGPFLNKPTGAGGNFQSTSYESSSFSSSTKGQNGDVDISKNPFLNGAFNNKFGQGSSFQANAQGSAFSQGQGQSGSVNKFSGGSAQSGYTGSSPSPFMAYNGGSNVNSIQNSQKAFGSEYDYEQQSQQNIDEAFKGTGNVHGHEHSGGELQQTCAGQGYVCVHKAQCNNGVVNTNGAGILQAKTKKQYCNTRNEICCRIEIGNIPGARGVQGSLGIGSATASGSGSQESGIFAINSGSNTFGSSSTTGSSSSNSFGARGSGANAFGSASSGSNGFGATGSNGFQSGSSSQGSFASTTNLRGTSLESGSSSNQGTNFGATNSFGQGNNRGGVSSFESKGGFGSNGFTSSGSFGAGSNSNTFNGGASFGSTTAPGGFSSSSRFDTNEFAIKGTKNTQTNFIETDSFSAGSEIEGSYRPGASGSGLKPGIPYLPPVASNTVTSTVLPPTPAYIPPPTPSRPVYTAKPTYLPPSTAAPGYLPPVGEQSIHTETRLPKPSYQEPSYQEGSLLLDQNRNPNRPRQPIQPAPSEIPAGCAAALKCTPVEYCTAEGVISNTTVILTKDQEAYRVPLTDCKDLETGNIGKCCRDPLYTDPWPTNQLGKWVPGVFGGNDGKYTPDNRGSFNNPRPSVVTGRPHTTGSTILNDFRSPQPSVTPAPYPGAGITQGFGQKGQFEVRGQGQYGQVGVGQYSQGQTITQTQREQASAGQGQRGQGQYVQQGQGSYLAGGQGQYSQSGQGQYQVGGRGQVEIQEQDSQSQYTQISGQTGQRGVGQSVIQGQGQSVSQGFGTGIRQGGGVAINQGAGFGIEQDSSESSLYRFFLQQYSAGGQCGILNGQKPYGNRNELEVDFAEIPWQAMVLLQTNRSLLCGGVITRPDVVVTSAACVDGLEAKNVLIKGGEWKLGIDEEPLPFQIVQVKHILRHPEYQRGSLHNDVAILVLTENLRWAKNIYPICLPEAQETLDAYYNGAGECIVTGWGKQVLQAHLAGSIMHSLNVSLINPGECQAKLSSDYPHLLEQYDQNSCACGVPTNPVNSNICRVDIGSALACTTGNGHYVLKGIYSWDSGCQQGNQVAAFYKFDLEWYLWALGLSEGSGRFAQFGSGTQVTNNRYSQISTGVKGGQYNSGVKGGQFSGAIKGQFGNQFGGQYSQFASSKFSESQSSNEASGLQFGAQLKGPIQNTFSASYSEKKVFQSEPKIVTFTTKPEIVTFTTKPEIFTYTTKPKLVTYTTKPQIITYETSGSGQNPQYVAPGVTFNPSFSEVIGQHQHTANCKCGKK